ncbi:HET-domain-containing protein [Ganoderma leucocontextum]|nr:HET-domain-containing protein [Ganoderma leucocontextum]
MWLLNTDNAVLQYFASPEDVPGGYAIISHIWDAEEDNFQDMMKLREVHKAGRTPPNPLSRVREKTRKCCELACSQGFQYVWIDSCCGDRSHVAELSKDVQSQFLYFSLAHVCYVYLPDVGGCDPRVTDSPFRASKWHTSPWALQELIAPDMVIFYSKEWTVLGTKQNLAPLLEEITGVPATVLIFKEDPTSFSVAARMSWASQRQPTARPEEQAYSLLGIMGVSMDVPPYGEGWRAFQRLQEEITKQLADTTVFVWGDKPALSYSEVTRIVRGLPPVSAAHTHHADESFLFAPAPSVFKSGFAETRSMPHLPIGDTMYTLDTSNLSTFTVTSNAVLAHIPVIELKDQRILIAFISCSMDNKPLGLVLEKCPNTSSGVPLYDVGLDDPNGSGTFRLVTLDDVSEGGSNGGRAGDVTFVWRTIHIRGRHIHDPSQDFQRVPMNRDLSSFYLPRLLLKKFGGRFLPRKPVVSTEHDASLLDQKVSISLQPAASPNSSAQDDSSAEASLGKESLPATFLFFADVTARRLPFLVHFGRCTVANGASGESGAHWAKVERHDGGGDAEWFEFQPSIPTHACLADHISGWQNQQKTFPIAFKPTTYGIRLSFSESEAFGTTKVLVPDIVTAYNR